MGRPTNDDPDLDKSARKPPAAGKRGAHRPQAPSGYAPQRSEKDDLRRFEKGDKKECT